MTDYSLDNHQLLRVAKKAALAGGIELLKRFGKMNASGISKKAQANYASQADLAAERAIFNTLTEEAAGFGFLGEETGFQAGTRKEMWVVDPLDGTSNFIWGIPYFAVSIALCDDAGEILGVVYDPLREEYFTAIAGEGTYLNGQRVARLADKLPEESLCSLSLPIPGQLQVITQDQLFCGLTRIMAESAGVRRLGSAALDLAYVGIGRLDAYFEDGLSYYDIAAGKLIAQENGIRVSKFHGEKVREGSVLAARPSIYDWFRNAFLYR
ncbi:MAG: inositol monophosphatase family protein [Dickeya sp.]|nr:myo-inositol-1(or 4)-monophosphatase [Erwinia sp. AG740]